RDRERPASARRAVGRAGRRRSARTGEIADLDGSRQLSGRRPGDGRSYAGPPQLNTAPRVIVAPQKRRSKAASSAPALDSRVRGNDGLGTEHSEPDPKKKSILLEKRRAGLSRRPPTDKSRRGRLRVLGETGSKGMDVTSRRGFLQLAG